jgi:Ca-activated chloride channel family protein
MNRAVILLAAGASCLAPAWAQEPIVFRSDVSLVRIDAQVVDGGNRAITHLSKEDFVVREEGRPQLIRNFASEEMPIDVLFLLDVSASMRPHVQRIADAAGQAFAVLGKDDRLAIMVFDRSTRLRIRFSGSRAEVQREFDRLLRQEQFNGGTDITRAMFDAADYIRREGRQEARRAIVILTDDRPNSTGTMRGSSDLWHGRMR